MIKVAPQSILRWTKCSTLTFWATMFTKIALSTYLLTDITDSVTSARHYMKRLRQQHRTKCKIIMASILINSLLNLKRKKDRKVTIWTTKIMLQFCPKYAYKSTYVGLSSCLIWRKRTHKSQWAQTISWKGSTQTVKRTNRKKLRWKNKLLNQ
jgi:hypothetical protein